MHAIMSYVGANTAALVKAHGTSWQDGYYNTRVKTAKQFNFVASYIEQNPVAKGLVESASNGMQAAYETSRSLPIRGLGFTIE
jgi:hypothetical protein